MPMQVVPIRRWEIALAFVLLTLAFVFSLWLVNRESKQRSAANRELIADIQQSRAEVTYTSCKDQNARHDATVMRIDAIIIERKQQIRQAIQRTDDPAAQATFRGQLDQIDDGRSTTVSLIDALAPHQNCDQIVLDRYGFIPEIQGGQ
jgi:hypothetical protein